MNTLVSTPELREDRSVLRRLHDDETGSQAMEYGALAAGGCGVVGILLKLLSSETVQDRLAGVITSIIDQLGSLLGGLF